VPTLAGRTVVNFFYEDSTRHADQDLVRGGAKRLSADVINSSAKAIQPSPGREPEGHR